MERNNYKSSWGGVPPEEPARKAYVPDSAAARSNEIKRQVKERRRSVNPAKTDAARCANNIKFYFTRISLHVPRSYRCFMDGIFACIDNLRTAFGLAELTENLNMRKEYLAQALVAVSNLQADLKILQMNHVVPFGRKRDKRGISSDREAMNPLAQQDAQDGNVDKRSVASLEALIDSCIKQATAWMAKTRQQAGVAMTYGM